jgi:hypothetical protein
MTDLTVGIFSWNIGDANKEKIKDLIVGALSTYNDIYPDIFIFGFQEYNSKEYDRDIAKYIVEQINIKIAITYSIVGNNSTCNRLTPYKIINFAFIKNKYKVDKIIKESICIGADGSKGFFINLVYGTKGFELIKFTINESDLIFINVHFPFKTEKILSTVYDELKKFISSPNNKNSIIFVSGDVNSRCLLTNSYTKDVLNCETKDESSKTELEKKLCDTKTELEKIPFPETHYFHDYKNQIEDTKLIKDLKSTDYYIKEADKSLFFNDNFQEGDIHFLPTYKRDSISGYFSLFKNEKSLTRTFTRTLSKLSINNSADSLKREQDINENYIVGRLPGYADRIFFKAPDNKSIQCLKYGSLGIKGNDHLPIGGHYLITNKTTGGRAKLRKRSSSKKSKSRQRSRSKKSRSKGKK